MCRLHNAVDGLLDGFDVFDLGVRQLLQLKRCLLETLRRRELQMLCRIFDPGLAHGDLCNLGSCERDTDQLTTRG